MIRTALTLAVLAACCASPSARAETTTCTQITSLPATLTTQGVYCLKKDLTTAMASGNAITVATNNVTIDCNGYKLGGLAAGTATQTVGVSSLDKLNTVVRNCNVRGFRSGIYLTGGGHLAEGNRLDGNTVVGILITGDGGVVLDNSVLDTGGPDSSSATGIYAGYGSIDVMGNLVSGVGLGATGQAKGMVFYAVLGGTIADNRIRGITSGSGISAGMHIYGGSEVSVRDNVLFGQDEGWGIYCGNANVASGNHSLSWEYGIKNCVDGGNNVVADVP